MRARKKSSILKKAVLLLALAGLLGNGVFAETTFAGIRGEEQEQMLTRDDIYAEYQRNVQCSVYPAPGGDFVEVLWYKVGENRGGFTSVDLDTGRQILILQEGYEMSFWYEIDNGGEEVVQTLEQKVKPLYAAYKNERSSGPADEYCYEKDLEAAEQSVCYDLPQNFNYRSLGKGIVPVEFVARITEQKSGDSRVSVRKAVYLDIPGEGEPSIFNLKPTDREIYRVKKGDTLQSIAEERYCDTALWSEIFRRNRRYIRNADLIYAGQMIVIPKTEAEIAGDVIVIPPRREIPDGDEALLYSDICEMADLGGVYRLSDGTRADVEWKNIEVGEMSAKSGQQVLYLSPEHRMTYWFIIENGSEETVTDVKTIAPFYTGQLNENVTGPIDEYLYRRNTAPEADTVVWDLPPEQGLPDGEIRVTRVIRIVDTATGAYFEEETTVDSSREQKGQTL